VDTFSDDSISHASNGNNDGTYDINDDTYDTCNDDNDSTYAANGTSNAGNEGNVGNGSPDVSQFLYHPSGTNDVLIDGGSMGKEARGAGKGRGREVFAGRATLMPT
jgi:hypothetical protein